MDQFVGAGWQEFVEIKAAAWLNFYSDWLENNPHERLLVIHYENMRQTLQHSLKKILAFLGFEADAGRIACASNFQTGHFKRTHKEDIRDNPYSEDQKKIIAKYGSCCHELEIIYFLFRSIKKLDVMLKKHNKESLPLQKYKHYDP